MSGPVSVPLAPDKVARRVALKIDVDTLRGTLEGVPQLLQLLQGLGAQATFYFSVGPDHTGRALKRVFRRGFLGKVRRTSVLQHYGWKTLLYGTLLPGPDIGRHAGDVMRAVRDAGFEVGLHCHNHVRWQDGVSQASASWTRAELERGVAAFKRVFGHAPQSHAAAGWQINPHMLVLEYEYAFLYASDTRGLKPFVPSMDGVMGRCAQLPTTLPTFDELIGVDDQSADDAVQAILKITRARPGAHVFTLHAELEGQKLAPQFADLLKAWVTDGFELVALRDLFSSLPAGRLPRHATEMDEIPGRSGTLAVQGHWVTDTAAT